MLECVVNVSEGRRPAVLADLERAAGDALLDVHTDPDHHRSVLTLVGEDAPRSVTLRALELIDMGAHRGAHPRIGAVDVVPFVPLGAATMDDALGARDRFARWAGHLGLPCYLYGPERSLPDVRRSVRNGAAPDIGPAAPHETGGAVAVGARPVLVAYNLWLAEPDLALAQRLATRLRSSTVRTLALTVGVDVQLSANLISPLAYGPADLYDAAAAEAEIARAELVGLAPRAALAQIPAHRWSTLDLADDRTIEARLEAVGLRPEDDQP